MTAIELTFNSTLTAETDDVWRWITSVDGISRELAPLLRMTVPRGLRNITDADVELGQRLFRSWVLLFGVIPVDRSDLTLVSLDQGKGFVEQSPLLSMRLWRHERRLDADDGGTVLTDRLTFEPRAAAWATAWFIRKVFTHRHRVLRRSFGEWNDGGAGESGTRAV